MNKFCIFKHKNDGHGLITRHSNQMQISNARGKSQAFRNRFSRGAVLQFCTITTKIFNLANTELPDNRGRSKDYQLKAFCDDIP